MQSIKLNQKSYCNIYGAFTKKVYLDHFCHSVVEIWCTVKRKKKFC